MRILISGASIAGLSAAVALGRRGHQVTVVERAASVRRGGSPVDVRGDALGVAARLGLRSAIEAARVTFNGGFTFVDEDGTPVAALPVSVMNDADDDVEIDRDTLLDILAGAVDSSVTLRFGDQITDLTDTGDGVQIRLASGSSGDYDLVVGADGLHSAVRRTIFGPEVDYVRHLGMYVGLVRLDPGLGQRYEALLHTVPQRSALLSNYGNRAFGLFVFRSPQLTYDYRDVEVHRRLTRQAFDGVTSWQVPQLLKAVDSAPDYYFDAVAQVHMPRWSQGRVVLAGDAAHCASFFSGRGTSLAMLGAALLAEELPIRGTETADVFAALDRYARRLRPYVEHAQASVAEAQEILVPTSVEAINARNQRFAPFLRVGWPAP